MENPPEDERTVDRTKDEIDGGVIHSLVRLVGLGVVLLHFCLDHTVSVSALYPSMFHASLTKFYDLSHFTYSLYRIEVDILYCIPLSPISEK